MNLEKIFIKYFNQISGSANEKLQELKDGIQKSEITGTSILASQINEKTTEIDCEAKAASYKCAQEIAKEIPELRTLINKQLSDKLTKEAERLLGIIWDSVDASDEEIKDLQQSSKIFINALFNLKQNDPAKADNIFKIFVDPREEYEESIGLIKDKGLTSYGQELLIRVKEAYEQSQKSWDYGIDLNDHLNLNLREYLFYIWSNTHPNQFHKSMLIDNERFSLDSKQKQLFIESLISVYCKNMKIINAREDYREMRTKEV